MFVVQGLFAIIEFEAEESAQKALSHDEDIVLRGRRLVVRPRRVKQQLLAPSDDHVNDNIGNAEQTPGDPHSQLLSKLTNCGNVHVFVVNYYIHVYIN